MLRSEQKELVNSYKWRQISYLQTELELSKDQTLSELNLSALWCLHVWLYGCMAVLCSTLLHTCNYTESLQPSSLLLPPHTAPSSLPPSLLASNNYNRLDYLLRKNGLFVLCVSRPILYQYFWFCESGPRWQTFRIPNFTRLVFLMYWQEQDLH